MKKKSGSFGSSSKKSTLDESEVISAVGSSIVAGNTVLVAGHDLKEKRGQIYFPLVIVEITKGVGVIYF